MSVSITKRRTKSGARWQVRYRNGGRAFKQVHAGSFPTLKAAKERERFCVVELAAGRDPVTSLRETFAPVTSPGLRLLWDQYTASRVDVGAETLDAYAEKRDRICAVLGDKTDPATLTVGTLQLAIGELSSGPNALAPSTLRNYFGNLALVLDYGSIEPNPARDKRLRKPQIEAKTMEVPSTADFEALLAFAEAKYPHTVLAFELMECLGLRCKEVLELQRGDLDLVERRIRIAAGRTKAKSGGVRWLPTPDRLLDALALHAAGRAGSDAIFTGLDGNHLRYVMRKAKAGNPHLLRHRRISLWIGHGFNPVQVKEWAGHTKAEMSMNVYGHVLVSGDDLWGDFWSGTYRATRVLA